jgi:hypothetical protein
MARGKKHTAEQIVSLLRHPVAPIAASGVGVTLLIWMAVEIAIVGYSNRPPLQLFYILLGAVITSFGLSWRVTLGPLTRKLR